MKLTKNLAGKIIQAGAKLLGLSNNFRFYVSLGSSITQVTIKMRINTFRSVTIDWGNGTQTYCGGTGALETYVSNYTTPNINRVIQITGDLDHVFRFENSNAHVTFLNSNAFVQMSRLEELYLSGGKYSIFNIQNLSDTLTYCYINSSTTTANGSITRLVNLTRIELITSTSGAITGTLPVKLTYCSIAGNSNSLTGTLPVGLTYVNINGLNNVFTGTLPSELTYIFYLEGNSNTFTGTLPVNLTYSHYVVGINNAFTGTLPVNLTGCYFMGNNNSFTGTLPVNLNIAHIYGNNNAFTGTLPVGLTLLNIFGNNNAFTGIIPINCQFFNIGGTITKPANLTANTALCYFLAPSSWVLSDTEVNQYLADFWANRAVIRLRAERTIDLRAGAGTSAPTGQGITDKAALAAYQTLPGTTYWTVLTR